MGSETDAEYNEDDYGDLPSRREGGDEVGMEDGSPLRKGKPKGEAAHGSLCKSPRLGGGGRVSLLDSASCHTAITYIGSYCRIRLH